MNCRVGSEPGMKSASAAIANRCGAAATGAGAGRATGAREATCAGAASTGEGAGGAGGVTAGGGFGATIATGVSARGADTVIESIIQKPSIGRYSSANLI